MVEEEEVARFVGVVVDVAAAAVDDVATAAAADGTGFASACGGEDKRFQRQTIFPPGVL